MEASYREQMKERVEMLRERVEGVLRAEVEAELTAKLSSEMQEQLKAEQTKEQTRLEERLRQRSEQRSHEVFVQVRHGIRRVMEWKRGMMRDQVRRATGQVRDCVVRE